MKQNVLPFAILKQGDFPPRNMDSSRIVRASTKEARSLLNEILISSSLLFIDFETKGLNPFEDSSFALMGLGIASDDPSVLPIYLGVDSFMSEEEQNLDREALYLSCLELQMKPLVAHNVSFDAMVFTWSLWQAHGQRIPFKDMTSKDMMGLWGNWVICTYGMYRALASEDWLGQKHSLKDAMHDLLGWQDTNEKERDDWLISNGFFRRQSRNGKTVDIPNKGEMWRVPFHILGHYCLLDCEATRLLYDKVLRPAAFSFVGLQHFHREYFMDLVFHIVWQKAKGVTVRLTGEGGLLPYKDSLIQETKEMKSSFFQREDVAPHISAFHKEKMEEFLLTKPKTCFKAVSKLSPEPKKYNISGKLSTTWQNWEKKRVEFEKDTATPVPTESYLKWEERRVELEHAMSNLHNQEEAFDDEDEEDETLDG